MAAGAGMEGGGSPAEPFQKSAPVVGFVRISPSLAHHPAVAELNAGPFLSFRRDEPSPTPANLHVGKHLYVVALLIEVGGLKAGIVHDRVDLAGCHPFL